MPELPEVETIARGVNEAVAGRTIEAVGLPRPDVLREVTARTFAKRVRGTRITGAPSTSSFPSTPETRW
jgi:formamidopyrimidine-DNA glycosylase